MSAPSYAPTQAPGDTRRRCRYVGIWIPHDGPPRVDVLEQEVVRLGAGEQVLADLPGFPRVLADLSASFPVRDPATDAETGQRATVAQALALIYSWTRAQQLERDAAETPTTP